MKKFSIPSIIKPIIIFAPFHLGRYQDPMA